MLGESFTRIVDECLHRLDRGEDLSAVLVDFPDYAERLKPLLLVAMASRALVVPQPSENSRRMGKNQMLGELDQMTSRHYLHEDIGFSRFQSWYQRLVNSLRARSLIQPAPSYRLAMAALVIAFGVGLFAVSASASSLPGGLLGAFRGDIHQALGGLIGAGQDPRPARPPSLLFSGGDLTFGGSRAAKVAFLLDVLIDGEPQANPASPAQGSGPSFEQPLAELTAASEDPLDAGYPDAGDDPVSPDLIDQDLVLPDGILDNPGLPTAPGLDDGEDLALPPGIVDNPGLVIAPGLQDVDGQDVDDGEKDKDKKDKKDKLKDIEDQDQEE